MDKVLSSNVGGSNGTKLTLVCYHYLHMLSISVILRLSHTSDMPNFPNLDNCCYCCSFIRQVQ